MLRSPVAMTLAELPPWLIRAFAIALGLVIGSFLNVVIARAPKGESLSTPSSHCACGRPIAWYDNVPIVSWLVLRGRARCCGAKISVRYVLVEAIGGALAWAIVEVDVYSAPPEAVLGPLVGRATADLSLSLALVAAAFIDLEHMFLPDPITIGGTVFAFVTTALFRPDVGWQHALIGAMVGFWGIYLPFIVVYRVVRGKQGMGLGDAKLLALIGAWFGWRGVVFSLFAGSVQGTLAAIAIFTRSGAIAEPASIVAEREQALAAGEPLDPEADPVALPPGPGLGAARVAFGPFLILAALEYLLFARAFLQRWFAWVVEP